MPHEWYEHRTTHQRICIEAIGNGLELYTTFEEQFRRFNATSKNILLTLVIHEPGESKPSVLYRAGGGRKGDIRFHDYAIRTVDDFMNNYIQVISGESV